MRSPDMKSIVTVCILVLAVDLIYCSPFPNPIHASCDVDWNFGVNCSNASQAIIAQIRAWAGSDCGTGEKCKYTFDSFNNMVLKARHTTPVKNYTDDLTFSFEPNGPECAVNGKSTSEVWYAVLDYGTNYCNLHNLVTGAKLDQTKHYTETTTNWRCTQYSSANCDKY